MATFNNPTLSLLQGIRAYVCVNTASYSFMGSGVADAFIAKAFPSSPGSEFAISYTTSGADQFAVSFNGFVIRFCITNSNCPSESAGLAATLLQAVAFFGTAVLTSTIPLCVQATTSAPWRSA
jgi:hypothetical protein